MKKILLTGATGYIGKRLLPVLLDQEHHVVCCTRDIQRFEIPESVPNEKIDVIEIDFLRKEYGDECIGMECTLFTALYSIR